MSWASKRQTTRPEDEGYCLMGLFRVHMPLLYGEGRNAFLRLQYEIVRQSNDESLFAWHMNDPQSGIFATSPVAFARSGDISPTLAPGLDRAPYTITNKGLAFDAEYRILPFRHLEPPVGCTFTARASSFTYVLLPLDCATGGMREKPFTLILQIHPRDSPRTFVRLLPEEDHVYEKYFALGGKPQRRVIYIQRYMDLRGDVEKRYSHQWLSPTGVVRDRIAGGSRCTSRAGSVVCSELEDDTPDDNDPEKSMIIRQRSAIPLCLHALSSRNTLTSSAKPKEAATIAQGQLSYSRATSRSSSSKYQLRYPSWSSKPSNDYGRTDESLRSAEGTVSTNTLASLLDCFEPPSKATGTD